MDERHYRDAGLSVNGPEWHGSCEALWCTEAATARTAAQHNSTAQMLESAEALLASTVAQRGDTEREQKKWLSAEMIGECCSGVGVDCSTARRC